MTNKELKSKLKDTHDYVAWILKSKRDYGFLTDSAIESIIHQYDSLFEELAKSEDHGAQAKQLFSKIQKHASKLFEILRRNAGRKTENPEISTR